MLRNLVLLLCSRDGDESRHQGRHETAKHNVEGCAGNFVGKE